MTLNLTLATKEVIHQSADFRLTKNGTLITDASPKQILIRYSTWHGVVTYTGVAELDGLNTSEWLVQKLQHPLGERTLDEITEIIRIDGTRAIGRLAELYPHSFVVAAFVNQEPRVILISNFERIDSVSRKLERSDVPKSTLSLFTTVPQRQLYATGSGAAAVGLPTRQSLRFLLRKASDPRKVREQLARITEEASKVDKTVSAACSCFTIVHDGRGWGEHWGHINAEYIPPSLMMGVDTGKMSREVAQKLAESGEWPLGREILETGGHFQVRQVAWSSSQTNPAKPKKRDS